MDKVTQLELPTSGTHIYHIAGDWHSFSLHKPTYNILIDHALLLPKNQRRLIINGDFVDIPYGMKKNEGFKFWKSRAHNAEEFFLPTWEEESKWANNLLDELQSVFTEIIFIGGNHDQPRLDNIKKAVGHAYEHNFNIETSFHLKERNIKYIDYNHWLDIGKLSITHGQAHGTTACKKHYEKSGGRSVIFSHVHQLEVKSFHSRGDAKQVCSLPAMCHLNPEYLRETETNWTNGFGVFGVKPNGKFNLQVYQIWDDELVLPTGKILRG